MNIKILLFLLVTGAVSSCSTTYKSGQTPDDVYYSPARTIEEDSRGDNREENVKNEPRRDREVQMCVYDRRWRDFDDDYNYRYDPYHYGYSYGYYYNPYYCYSPVFITNVTIANPKNTVPRMSNLGSYNNTTYAIQNTKTGFSGNSNKYRPYNNSNNINTYIRKILTTPAPEYQPNNNSTRSYENNNRSYSPSSGSSGSSSGGSGTPVTRPNR